MTSLISGQSSFQSSLVIWKKVIRRRSMASWRQLIPSSRDTGDIHILQPILFTRILIRKEALSDTHTSTFFKMTSCCWILWLTPILAMRNSTACQCNMPESWSKALLKHCFITEGRLCRNQMMSSRLNKELIYVQQMVQPLLQTLQRLDEQLLKASQSGNNAEAKNLLSSIRLALRVFFSLNSPGLTEVQPALLPTPFSLN